VWWNCALARLDVQPRVIVRHGRPARCLGWIPLGTVICWLWSARRAIHETGVAAILANVAMLKRL